MLPARACPPLATWRAGAPGSRAGRRGARAATVGGRGESRRAWISCASSCPCRPWRHGSRGRRESHQPATPHITWAQRSQMPCATARRPAGRDRACPRALSVGPGTPASCSASTGPTGLGQQSTSTGSRRAAIVLASGVRGTGSRAARGLPGGASAHQDPRRRSQSRSRPGLQRAESRAHGHGRAPCRWLAAARATRRVCAATLARATAALARTGDRMGHAGARRVPVQDTRNAAALAGGRGSVRSSDPGEWPWPPVQRTSGCARRSSSRGPPGASHPVQSSGSSGRAGQLARRPWDIPPEVGTRARPWSQQPQTPSGSRASTCSSSSCREQRQRHREIDPSHAAAASHPTAAPSLPAAASTASSNGIPRNRREPAPPARSSPSDGHHRPPRHCAPARTSQMHRPALAQPATRALDRRPVTQAIRQHDSAANQGSATWSQPQAWRSSGIAKRRPEGGLDAVPASWTMEAEEDGPARLALSAL